MLSLTLKTIKAKKVRFVLTATAVMLGVAFMAGTFVLTDTIKQSYNDLTGNVYKSTDAVVRSARHVNSQENGDVRGTIAASTLAQVRKAKGVASAEPQQFGIAIVVAKNGQLLDANPNRAAPIGMAWQNDSRLNPMAIVNGHAPRAPNEVAIDRMSATKGHFTPGETVHVVSKSGSHAYKLAGVATYAGSDSANGAQVVAFTPETAATVLGTPGHYDAISVVAVPGFSQQAVVKSVQAVLHNRDVEVITGAAVKAEAQAAAGTKLQFMNTFLLSFALTALLVGSFVIYNTFSITVAQRSKETALLRAIGAKRSQVMRSVLFESVFTGIFASAVGVLAGIGLAKGLGAVLESFGVELPKADTVLAPRTFVVSIITGLVITVIAAYMPARKAAKVAPVAAMRDVAVEHGGASVKRAVIGVVTTLSGAAVLAMGLSAKQVPPVALGALTVFLGVTVLGPVIARPFARLLGAPLTARGMSGTLARENASRNPKRTAATASALMIGVGLVAFITVFAASAKASVSTSVDRAMRSDWIIDTQWGMGGLSPQVAQRIDALPETGAVNAIRYTTPTIDGHATDISAFEPKNVERNVRFDLKAGAVDNMGPHSVAVQESEAKVRGLHVGDTVSMFFPETGLQRFRVAAIYGTREPLGNYAISIAAYDANVADHVDSYVTVSAAPGVSKAEASHAVEGVLHDFPNGTMHTKEQFKGSMAVEINQMLNMIYVLLLLALVIALFGIANTLALSVFERTHEFGLLRAVGMSRSQARSTVRWESVLIALLGTVLGTVIGLAFGWALVKALASKGFNTFVVPSHQLFIVIALAAVAAVVAAALPARRAARLDVLKAITE